MRRLRPDRARWSIVARSDPPVSSRVDGETEIYGVLGHPVHHSLSPLIQNAAFRASGRNAVYLAMDVSPDRLGEALRGLHACGVTGLNLTSPHKEATLPFLAEATPAVERVGSANTLKRVGRGWLGHTTDGPGFVAWIRSLGLPLRGSRILILGAGGAARSLAPEIASLLPAAMGFVSRNGARAAALADAVREHAPSDTRVTSSEMAGVAAAREGESWDVLVRAIASASVEASEGAWWERLAPQACVIELNYGERARESRAIAAQRGARFEDGRGLLLHQGALSFEFWTGVSAPVPAMKAALDAARG
jgi:shikimate dehydrogenase